MKGSISVVIAGCFLAVIFCCETDGSPEFRAPVIVTVSEADTQKFTNKDSLYIKEKNCDALKPSAGKGIGPVDSIQIGPVNGDMANQGDRIFRRNCSHCHGLTTPEIGPALGDVTKRRTPEFIMNVILNTEEMEEKDSVMQGLIQCYKIRMPSVDLDSTQARKVLEFFRTLKKKD